METGSFYSYGIYELDGGATDIITTTTTTTTSVYDDSTFLGYGRNSLIGLFWKWIDTSSHDDDLTLSMGSGNGKGVLFFFGVS